MLDASGNLMSLIVGVNPILIPEINLNRVIKFVGLKQGFNRKRRLNRPFKYFIETFLSEVSSLPNILDEPSPDYLLISLEF